MLSNNFLDDLYILIKDIYLFIIFSREPVQNQPCKAAREQTLSVKGYDASSVHTDSNNQQLISSRLLLVIIAASDSILTVTRSATRHYVILFLYAG